MMPEIFYWPGHPPSGLLFSAQAKNILQQLHPSLIKLINLLLFALAALYANYTVHLRKMFPQRHVLPAVGMVLFGSLIPFLNQYHQSLLLIPLVVAMFGELTRLYTNQNANNSLINTGLIWGLGFLWYKPFLLMLPVCLYGLAIMRPFRLVEWMLFLLGCFTPLYFLLSYEYLTDNWHPRLHLIPETSLQDLSFLRNGYWYGCIGFVLFLFLLGINAWQVRTRRMVIQSRKNWYLLLVMAVFLLPGAFWPQGNFAPALCILIFPVGVMISNIWAAETRSVGQLVIFWVSLVAAGTFNYLYGAGLLPHLP